MLETASDVRGVPHPRQHLDLSQFAYSEAAPIVRRTLRCERPMARSSELIGENMWITRLGSQNKWTDKSQVALVPGAHVISRQNCVPDQSVFGIGWERPELSLAPELGTTAPHRIQSPAPKVLEDHGRRDCTAGSWKIRTPLCVTNPNAPAVDGAQCQGAGGPGLSQGAYLAGVAARPVCLAPWITRVDGRHHRP